MNTCIELTSRGRYAVTAMVELARAEQGKPVPLADISKRHKISLSYLEQLFAGLRKHGLVSSTRGPGGGYRLIQPASQIKISDIVMAAEDCAPALRSKRPGKRKPCDGPCPSMALWQHIADLLHHLLSRITLDDVSVERLDLYAQVFKKHDK